MATDDKKKPRPVKKKTAGSKPAKKRGAKKTAARKRAVKKKPSPKTTTDGVTQNEKSSPSPPSSTPYTPCVHPRKDRKVFGWGSLCGVCNRWLR